jgi:chromosome segregation and condensation protein ScpB
MSLKSQIESLLFIAAKPLSLNDLNKILSKDKKEIEKELSVAGGKYSISTISSGVY